MRRIRSRCKTRLSEEQTFERLNRVFDFDCVAASILERGYPKAVVITDGSAGVELRRRD